MAEMMTVEDLKKTLHIGNNKAYKLCEYPGFPAFRIGDGQWLINKEKFDEWLAKINKSNTKSIPVYGYMGFITQSDVPLLYTDEQFAEINKLLEPDND